VHLAPAAQCGHGSRIARHVELWRALVRPFTPGIFEPRGRCIGERRSLRSAIQPVFASCVASLGHGLPPVARSGRSRCVRRPGRPSEFQRGVPGRASSKGGRPRDFQDPNPAAAVLDVGRWCVRKRPAEPGRLYAGKRVSELLWGSAAPGSGRPSAAIRPPRLERQGRGGCQTPITYSRGAEPISCGPSRGPDAARRDSRSAATRFELTGLAHRQTGDGRFSAELFSERD
jgi:hypothetical protein